VLFRPSIRAVVQKLFQNVKPTIIPAMPIESGISNLGLDRLPMQETFAVAKEAGAAHLLLEGRFADDGPLFPCEPELIRELAAKHGVKVWAARVNLPAIAIGELENHPAYTQSLAAVIAYCAAAGINRLVLPLPPGMTLTPPQAAARLDQLASLIEKHGIRLVLATDRFHPGFRPFWAMFNAMQSTSVGLLVDTAYSTLVNESAALVVSTMNSRLEAVVLKDVERGGPAKFMPLCQGEAQIENYVERLMGIGLDIPVFVEFTPTGMAALGPAQAYLKSAGNLVGEMIRKKADALAAAKAPPAKPARPAPAAKPVGAAKPAGPAKPGVEKPVVEKPAADKPSVEKPAAENATPASRPAADPA
jgi:sugar phosphate isomerase/epimerase